VQNKVQKLVPRPNRHTVSKCVKIAVYIQLRKGKGKGNAVLLQAWSDPEGS